MKLDLALVAEGCRNVAVTLAVISIGPSHRVASAHAPYWLPRRQHAARSHGASCMGRACVMTASPTDYHASAERRIQELTKELSHARGELSQARGELLEAREQQAATAGILSAISNSPSDLHRIFREI